MGNMRNFKLQSAMEYLMTYGWAILIIAVVMVALFSLGILGGSSPLGTTCIASSGFTCSSPVLHNPSAATAGLTLVVGQATGASWTYANVIYVPQGVSVPSAPATPAGMPCGVAPILVAANAFSTATGTSGLMCPFSANAIGALNNGQTGSLYFLGNAAVPLGQSVSGVVEGYWATAAGGPVYQVQMATANLKSV